MRITTSNIHRIIEDERRVQAAHRRRDEMLRIKGRDLRKLVREVMLREGAFPEELEAAMGMAPPSPEEMAAAYDGDTVAVDPELQEAFEEALENPDYTDVLIDALEAMEPGDMVKFSMERFEEVGFGLKDLYVSCTTGGTWIISTDDPSDTAEFDAAGDAVIGLVLAGQAQLGMTSYDDGFSGEETDEEEPFDPMEDWMEDERRSMRGEDY